MDLRRVAVPLVLVFVGCSPSATESVQTGSGSSANSAAATGAGNSTLVTGSGFTVQVPVDWKALVTEGRVGLTSRFDASQNHGIVICSIAVTPAGSLTPADAVASMVQHTREFDQIDSESSVSVSGRPATRLVTTTSDRSSSKSDEVHVTRNLHVLVPLETGVLSIQAFGNDADMLRLTAELDAMVASVTLQ